MNDKQAASFKETAVALVQLLFRIHQDKLKKKHDTLCHELRNTNETLA